MQIQSGIGPIQRTVGWIVAPIFLWLAAQNGRAADLPGARDHPLLKRFAHSEIIGYDIKRFDRYRLQTSTYKSYSFAKKTREYARPPLVVEGTVTRVWYEAAGQTSAIELMRNYQNELKANEFETLYDSTQDSAAVKWTGYFNNLGANEIRTNRSHYVFYGARDSGIQVCSAKLARPQGDIYVQLTALQWDRDHPVYKARQGAYIQVDIVEVTPMTQNMVTVTAGDMAKAITATGRVALYGIFFDFNKAEIKPESQPALEEIAKLLKAEPGLKLHVVGHTDTVGSLESNMTLSRNRADAVVKALVRDFDINPARLLPNGVAFLAPVAANTNEEGRAKNRRVELVPRVD